MHFDKLKISPANNINLQTCYFRTKDVIKNLLPLSEEVTTKVTFPQIPSHSSIIGNKTAYAMERTSLSNAIKHINSTCTETCIQYSEFHLNMY